MKVASTLEDFKNYALFNDKETWSRDFWEITMGLFQ